MKHEIKIPFSFVDADGKAIEQVTLTGHGEDEIQATASAHFKAYSRARNYAAEFQEAVGYSAIGDTTWHFVTGWEVQ